MKDLIQNEIETPDGNGTIEQIYLTELGYVMMRVYLKKKGTWQNIKIGDIKSMLNGTSYKLGKNFSIKRF